MIPGQGTKVLQAVWHGQKKKKKSCGHLGPVNFYMTGQLRVGRALNTSCPGSLGHTTGCEVEPWLKPLSVSAELVLERCDLELEANGRDHHTADLCRERLVVRRGQPFWLTLHFEGRNYEASVDSLTFCAVTGEYYPQPLPVL